MVDATKVKPHGPAEIPGAETTKVLAPHHPSHGDVIPYEPLNAEAVEKALVDGDLSKLTAPQRLAYLAELCKQSGLNALTRPFDFIKDDQGKLRMYTRKDAAEQLRKLHNISTKIVSRELVGEMYVVTAQAALPNGRQDEAIGVVSLDGLQGQKRGNMMMRCETKAKRRVTLSICGLGAHEPPDEEPSQGAGIVNLQTGEIRDEPRRGHASQDGEVKQALLMEARQLYKDTLRPLQHAGMTAAIAYHCFRLAWSDLPGASAAEIECGMPLLRHLCHELVVQGLPSLQPDEWITHEVQRLARRATEEVFDVEAEAIEIGHPDTPLTGELSADEPTLWEQEDAALADEEGQV